MREISWAERGAVELRIRSKGSEFRYGIARARRTGGGDLWHAPYDEPAIAVALPVAVQPLVTFDGDVAELDVTQEFGPDVCAQEIRLALAPSHEPVQRGSAPDAAEVIPAILIAGVEEPKLDEVRRRANLLPGVLLREDESVGSLGHSFNSPLWLCRLPRIVLARESEIADNTDALLSMGALLDGFVRRFSAAEHALAHVRIATGYLYRHGLARVLALLENPAVKTVELLFSGRTDRATAAALTALLADELRDDLDAETRGPELWAQLRDAAETGRLSARVYTDAFLHAKLFLGYEAIDELGKLRGGYAVVGSSNVSGPGLHSGGNLELDVSIDDRSRSTELYRWFAHRWNEAAELDPALLEVLERARPLPPPTFETDGMGEVWHCGRYGTLEHPDRHLAYLASLYSRRLHGLELPSDVPFAPDPERRITPTIEQEEGVLALAQRLQQARIAFLADSVGLGKTITTLGTAAFMRRNGLCERIALIAPQKLIDQWLADAARVRIPNTVVEFLNRHVLERMEPAAAEQALSDFDLLIVEEAHQSLRNRANKLWQHLRRHLNKRLDCRLLLVSATPWNNSREDIYNFLLLAWNEGRLLSERYPALGVEPLAGPLAMFRVNPHGNMPVRHGVRGFDELPRERYRQVFDGAFVQRTRSMLETRLGRASDFPLRQVHPHNTPPSESHDTLFAALAEELPELNVPYREPFRAFLQAVHARRATGETEPESNLKRSFLIQLYKRAESSVFALAVSLATVRRRLTEFRAELEALVATSAPLEALTAFLRERYLRLDSTLGPDDEEERVEEMSAAEKARFTNLSALLESLDEQSAAEVISSVVQDQVAPDLAGLDRVEDKLSFAVDEQSPKDLLLVRLARDAYTRGYKPVLVGGYADTATRTFVRLIDLLPDARIALVLGGGEAWLYRPGEHTRSALAQSEWTQAVFSTPTERRRLWLSDAGRAGQVSAADALDAFAPRAREATPIALGRTGGAVDILVGSEAISIGQNLQDSTCLIHLDLPWNPMVIEQRIGRIDRRGGGRPDPEQPHGRRIADVHYCWSDAAVEREVALRNRLEGKAARAIEDTNFDEILLYELADRIRRAREERAREASAADVLGVFQRSLVESRGRSQDLPANIGSELDGLRRLAAWAKENAEQASEPVIASAVRDNRESCAWWVTLELLPLDRHGNALPGEPKYLCVPVGDGPPEPDLETVVVGLAEGLEPTPWPLVGTRRWSEDALALDKTLQELRRTLLQRHNEECQERLRLRMSPAAKRDAGTKLKLLSVDARDALRAELPRLRGTATEALLSEKKEKVRFFANDGLDAAALPDLLAELGETVVHQSLVHIRDFARRVLEDEFDEMFDRLCGSRWQDRENETAQLEMPHVDGLWADVRMRVVAATYRSPNGARG